MTGLADSVGSATSSFRALVAESSNPGLRLFCYFVIPRVSRGIQEPRGQSVLQAFLDAATTPV